MRKEDNKKTMDEYLKEDDERDRNSPRSYLFWNLTP